MFFPPRGTLHARALPSSYPARGKIMPLAATRIRGQPSPGAVSKLSPYLRYRMITRAGSRCKLFWSSTACSAAEKFIQEILWRTYWKGWLEMRPSVWTQFQEERDRQRDSFPNTRAQSGTLRLGRPALKALTIGHASLWKRAICTITQECGLPQSGFLRCACHGR